MKKLVFFIYALIAYLVFIASFLYAIGFLGNFYVPKSIDSGLESGMFTSLLVNTLLLGLFAIPHSIMARPVVKKWLTKFIHPAVERSTYVLLSSLLLFFLFWQWQPLTQSIWQTENGGVVTLLNGMYFLGWLIVLLSTFMINHLQLFGLFQVNNFIKERSSNNPKFIKRYLYKIIRHPMMLGFLIAFWFTPKMSLGHLLFAVLSTAYIFVAVKYFEEKDLLNELGEDYKQYKNEVPMLFPFTKKKLK